MNKINAFLFALIIVWSSQTQAKSNPLLSSSKLYFVENKGQIKDQEGFVRNDIQFVLQRQGINVFVGDAQLHYQFSKRDEDNCMDFLNLPNSKGENRNGPSAAIETYRMDVELIGANKDATASAEERQSYYENYYLQGCTANGIQANTYKRIIYKNVYPGIDWAIYIKGNKLEHEFIVGPGGDASLIKLKYSGQSSLNINEDGSITAATPMGVINEKAPECFQQHNGRVLSRITSAFTLRGNVLSYDIGGYGNSVVIDPEVEWATYYGPDSSTSPVYAAVCDSSANIYICGLTYSDVTGTIATTGSYQYTYAGDADGYLVKFDSSGNRIWGTYYGGTGGDWGVGVACDHGGNVYVAGTTGSADGIATAGSQQPSNGGGLWDGFLAKFNDSGARQWATYVGGSGAEIPTSVVCDLLGHVYIAGFTSSSNNIGTPGSYQPTRAGGYEDFLVQYDTAGAKRWGTYYGGPGDEFAGAVCSDGYNTFLTGYTSSTSGIASPLAYQLALNGGQDAFLAKFNSAGSRIWGTYYGGEGPETVGGITCDNGGYIYLLGATGSTTGIASPGCFQPVNGGGTDAFLAKFEPELGNRLWGTYYGGPGTENVDLSKIITDNYGSVYVTGYTNSTSGIAFGRALQATYGGGDEDAFFAKYNSDGLQLWGSFYGGEGSDQGRACAFDGKNIYLSGSTNSTSRIATPGSFLPVGGGESGNLQGFLAKFTDTLISLSATVHPAMPTEKITIFPSPNNGAFTLSGTLAGSIGNVQIVITDMAGRVIMQDEAQLSNGIINKHIYMNGDVPSGAYLLKVISQAGVHVIKFMKE